MALAFEPPGHDPLLSVGDIAAAAGITRGTARAWCLSGRLPSVTGPRNEPLVRRSDLDAWLARRRPDGNRIRAVRDPKAGADALRRLASEVSGQIDLETLFADVVADAMDLFALARIGLWRYEAGRRHPLSLAAQPAARDGLPGYLMSTPTVAFQPWLIRAEAALSWLSVGKTAPEMSGRLATTSGGIASRAARSS